MRREGEAHLLVVQLAVPVLIHLVYDRLHLGGRHRLSSL